MTKLISFNLLDKQPNAQSLKVYDKISKTKKKISIKTCFGDVETGFLLNHALTRQFNYSAVY